MTEPARTPTPPSRFLFGAAWEIVKGLSDMTEREICEWMWHRIKEGQRSRRDHNYVQPSYAGNTVGHFLQVQGWCHEDLRMALMDAKPSYGEEQRRLEAAGVFG